MNEQLIENINIFLANNPEAEEVFASIPVLKLALDTAVEQLQVTALVGNLVIICCLMGYVFIYQLANKDTLLRKIIKGLKDKVSDKVKIPQEKIKKVLLWSVVVLYAINLLYVKATAPDLVIPTIVWGGLWFGMWKFRKKLLHRDNERRIPVGLNIVVGLVTLGFFIMVNVVPKVSGDEYGQAVLENITPDIMSSNSMYEGQ